MKELMFLPEKDFTTKYPSLLKQGRNLFWDRGGVILAVAHLDSVCKCTHAIEVKFPHKHVFYSPVLDDRLGVYVIMEELFDLPYDILLTTDEEQGNSSAKEFKTDKKYNWIFEFDRKGNDVVLYSFDDTDTRNLLIDAGFRIGIGSISDISYLTNLGCKAFNFGVCYYDYHSLDAFANLNELKVQIKLFRQFFNTYKDIHLPHTPAVKRNTVYIPKFDDFGFSTPKLFYPEVYYIDKLVIDMANGSHNPNIPIYRYGNIKNDKYECVKITSYFSEKLITEWAESITEEYGYKICDECSAIFVPTNSKTCKSCTKLKRKEQKDEQKYSVHRTVGLRKDNINP